jgi:RNA polymerase sigma-70 factor (ECF subfamily)
MAPELEDLFRAHWPLVFGYLRRRTGDPSAAEELAQETFYRATRAFLGWRGGSPVAWLLSIARHVLVDEVRRGRRLAPLPETLVDPTAPPDEQVAVADALNRLPEPQRRLLALVYVDGYSLAEVAALNGTTEGAAKTALWRARAAFRRVYGEDAVPFDSPPTEARK